MFLCYAFWVIHGWTGGEYYFSMYFQLNLQEDMAFDSVVNQAPREREATLTSCIPATGPSKWKLFSTWNWVSVILEAVRLATTMSTAVSKSTANLRGLKSSYSLGRPLELPVLYLRYGYTHINFLHKNFTQRSNTIATSRMHFSWILRAPNDNW